MGLLDLLTGNNAGASPYGALYPTTDDLAKKQQAAADLLASMGVSSTNLPQISAFDLPQPQSAAPAPAPAAPSFGQGATPFGFAGPGSMSGVNPATFAPPAAPAPQAAPAPTPTDLSSVNRPAAPQDQADPLAVGNYQMPRVGSTDSFEPDDTVPANAKPTQGVAPGASPSAAPFSLGGASSGVGDRLGMAARGFLGNLSAGPIGALMAGTGSLLMGRESDPTAIHSQQMNATGQALVAKGAPVADVRAAINNPALMTALIGQYYGKDKFTPFKTKDSFGNETVSVFNNNEGTFKNAPGQGAPGAAAAASAASVPENYDAATHRDEGFLKALDPTTRQMTLAIVNGDQVPTGRNLQKYMPYAVRYEQGFQPANYGARQTFAREAGSLKSGVGLQAKGFQQGLEHMAQLADDYAGKGNVNGLGFPDLAHLANATSEHLSNDQSAKALSIDSTAQTLSGEVGKLFSGSQGGGVHERQATAGRFSSRLAGPEAANALEATLDQMMGGLSSLNDARDRAYNGAAPAQFTFLGPQQQKQVDHIRGVIQQLRSGAASPASAPGGLPAGWSVKVR